MGARSALLDPADVERSGPELHLLPPEVRQFGSMQAMPIGHKDHRGVCSPNGFSWRFFISRSTSAWVRYSRVRRVALGGRLGWTVRFTVAGLTILRCDFFMRCAAP